MADKKPKVLRWLGELSGRGRWFSEGFTSRPTEIKGLAGQAALRSQGVMCRAAFTLIELLVVVSIIALLVSILLPALGKAREQAKKTVCSTRMRGLGMAAAIYSADTDFFPWYADTWPDGPPATVYYNVLAPYLGGLKADPDVAAYSEADEMNAYREIRRCPSGKYENGNNIRDWKGWIGPHFTIYNTPGEAYTAPFVWRLPGQGPYAVNSPVKPEKVRTPAMWVTFLDCYDWGFYSPAWLRFQQDMDDDGLADTGYGSERIYNWAMPKMHNGGCNIALFDGHGEFLKFGDFLTREWGDI